MADLPRSLRRELVTSNNDIIYPRYAGGRVDPRDETLLEKGGGGHRAWEIYQDVAKDPHAFAILQKRWMAVIGREWEVKAASESNLDRKAAELVERHLRSLATRFDDEENGEAAIALGGGFDQVCFELLGAILYGWQVSEIVWDQDNKEIFPAEIAKKDLRRFQFAMGDRGYKLRHLTTSNSFEGEPLPSRKFIVHRYSCGGLAQDPYGYGLGARLFFPRFFKSNSVKFWLVFADKWATPTAVGKFPRGSTTEQKDQLLRMLNSIATDAGVIMPDTMAIEFLEAQRSSTTSTYQELVNFCNSEMSKVVLGETGTTDQGGDGGSRARDQVGNEIRIEIAKGDADLLSDTLNRTLVRWIVQLNLPDATPPTVWRRFPELDEKEDLNARASRDSQIVQMGFSLTRKYITETYGVELEEEEAKNDPDQAPDVAGLLQSTDEAIDEPTEEPTAEPQPEMSEVDFAAKKAGKPRQCSKGYSCGASCISKGKECKGKVAQEASIYLNWIAEQSAKAKQAAKLNQKYESQHPNGESEPTNKNSITSRLELKARSYATYLAQRLTLLRDALKRVPQTKKDDPQEIQNWVNHQSSLAKIAGTSSYFESSNQKQRSREETISEVLGNSEDLKKVNSFFVARNERGKELLNQAALELAMAGNIDQAFIYAQKGRPDEPLTKVLKDIKKIAQANAQPNFTEAAKLSTASDQLDIPDRYSQQALQQQAPAVTGWLDQVRGLMAGSNSLEMVRDRLFSLYTAMPSPEFANVMGRSLAAVELAGRYEVILEGESTADLNESVDFRGAPGATKVKQRTCKKGYSCGFSCIQKGKQCRMKLTEQAAQYANHLQNQIKALEAQLAAAKAPQTPKPGAIAEVDPKTILADPKRFQYKVLGEHTKTGEVGSLSGVKKYDPNLAGIIQAWVDPADGKTYVVNGHNRLALGNRLGAEKVTVRYLDVQSAAEARAVGALTNIAEGRGTAIDAAKFFKDSGLTRDEVEAKGIPMREKIAQDGIALSKLEDSLFRRAIDGEMPVERATIIGDSGLDHQQQRSLVNLVDQQAKKRRNITNETVRELADSVRSASQRVETQFDLFGSSQTVQDNALERATLAAHVRQRLSREKKLFGTVGKSKAAEDLKRGGNIIDALTSQKLSQEAALTLGIFDQMKNLSSPVSVALNRAAERMVAGDSAKKVQDDLYKEIMTELPKMVGGKA